MRDRLTGLVSGEVFDDRLQNALDRRLRAPAPLALLLLDLDDFARVNADHGHEAGDEALRVVADRLRSCVRTEDTVARLRADVFAVLVDAPGAGSLAALGERVRSAVARPVPLGDAAVVSLDASVAVVVSDGGRSAEELLREAAGRVFDIKCSGSGRVELVVVPFD